MINLFIGYIFIFFHIKINGIDLLADFIGYILIYRGLCALSDLSLIHICNGGPLQPYPQRASYGGKHISNKE